MPSETGAGTQEFNVTKDIPLSTERKPDYFKVGEKVVFINPLYDYIIESGTTTKNGHDDDHNLDTIGIKLDVDDSSNDTSVEFHTYYTGLMTRNDYDYLHANPDYAKDWVNKHNQSNDKDTYSDRQEKQEKVDKIINAIINKPLNLNHQENERNEQEFDLKQEEIREDLLFQKDKKFH